MRPLSITLALLVTFIGLCAALVLSAQAQAADAPAYRTLAREVMRELEAVPVDRFPASSGYGVPSIAIRTSVESDATGAEDGAPLHTRKMLSALRNESKGRFKFIALGSLGNVIAAIQAQNLPADEQAARIRALRANAQADILVHGTVRTDGGVETLSYDAVSIESGELLASTGAVALGPQIPPLFADNGRGVLPPAQVVSKSVTGRYRPTVEEAERLLAEKGYDPGPVDGVMSPETRQALSDYQRNSALPVNGRMTRQTVENLRRDTRVVFY